MLVRMVIAIIADIERIGKIPGIRRESTRMVIGESLKGEMSCKILCGKVREVREGVGGHGRSR